MIARTRWPVTLGWLCVVVIATVLGAAVPRLAPTPGLPATLLLAAAIALGLGLMASGPTSCIAAIAALAMLGAQTLTARVVGPVDIQVADIFYAVLVFWVIARPPTDVRRGSALTVPAAGIPRGPRVSGSLHSLVVAIGTDGFLDLARRGSGQNHTGGTKGHQVRCDRGPL